MAIEKKAKETAPAPSDKQKAQKREQDNAQSMRLCTAASLSLARTHILTSRYVVPDGGCAVGAGWT